MSTPGENVIDRRALETIKRVIDEAPQTFADLLDTLAEARRYARVNPRETHGLMCLAAAGVALLVPNEIGGRIAMNFTVASRFLHAVPDVAMGYITGAILEIQDYEAKKK